MKEQIIFFLFSFISFAQNDYKSYDFSKIDSLAQTIKYKNNIANLVRDLTLNCNNDIEKTRAIYIWITENIAYDIKKYNKKKKLKLFKCKDNNDCQIKLLKWQNKNLIKTLENKKGICGDYSLLFKEMCSLASIKSYYIEGYTKENPKQVGKMGILNHAWNAVLLDEKYYYLDLTWASGSCSEKGGKLDKFHKKRNDFYWLIDQDKLYINHFPKDSIWLTNSTYNKEKYKNNPHISTNLIPKIELIQPESGLLSIKHNDTIIFKFKLKDDIEKIQINSNIYKNPSIYYEIEGKKTLNEKALLKQKYIEFNNTNEIYSFYIVAENKKLNYLEILFDYEVKLAFRIKYIN